MTPALLIPTPSVHNFMTKNQIRRIIYADNPSLTSGSYDSDLRPLISDFRKAMYHAAQTTWAAYT